MIRLLLIFATGVASVLIAIWVVPWFYSGDRLAETVTDRIAAYTGYEVIDHGPVEFTMLPIPRLVLKDVEVKARGRDAVLLSANAIVVDLNVLPLFTGHLTPGRVVLDDPEITLKGAPGGEGNWAPRHPGLLQTAVERVIAGGDMPREPPQGLGVVQIVDGTVRFEDMGRDRREISDLDMSVEWPSLDSALAVESTCRWNGHVIGGSISLDDPMDFLAGTFSPMAMSVRGDLGEMAFSGRAAYADDIQLDGPLDVALTSLGTWLNWIGYVDEPIQGLDDLRISADMNLIGTTMALDHLALSFDGNSGSGVMRLAETDGAIDIAATLDFPSLDVTPVIRPHDPGEDAGLIGRDVALDDDLLRRLTADVRVSAGNFKARAVEFGETAASLVVQDSKISIGIAEADFQGGRAKGTIIIAPSADGYDVRGQGSLSDVQIGKVIPAPGIMAIEGLGHAAVQIESKGATFAAFLGNLNGKARIEIEGGRLRGLDLPAVARALEDGDLTALAPDRRTETGFDRFAARFVIKDGIATTEHVEIKGAGVSVDGKAEIDLSDASLGGRGEFEVGATTQGEDKPTVLPFVVSGPLDHPLILPDLERILQRDRGRRGTDREAPATAN